MNTKAFKFAEEETYMMRPYQNFKELVLSSANSMGVKEGKISLKCLYWYLMYKGEITSEEYNNCGSFSYPGYKDAFSNKSRIEDILLDDLLQNHIKEDGTINEETIFLKGLIAIGKDSFFEWIDADVDPNSWKAFLTKFAYEMMSYEYFTLDDIDNPNKYDFESIYLYPGEYPIHKFFIEVKENRVVSRDTDYIGFRSFFKGLRAGSYHSVSSSNYEWVNVMSCVDCYITNQRIILMGVNNLTSANETKVIQLSSITRVVQEDSDLEIIRQNKNIRLDIYDKQDMALCKLILERLLNGSYDVDILPKDFYVSNNGRIVFSENYENQVEEVVEKIVNFFDRVLVQELKTDSDDADLYDMDKIFVDDYKYKTKNILAISLAVNSAENSQYFHSLIKENKEEWLQIIDAAFLMLKSYDNSFWQYEFEIVDEWRTGQTKYILFSSVYLKDSIDITENFDKYMDSIIEETDSILSNSYIKDNIVDLGDDKFSELKKYKELFDNNIITQEEFDTLKRRILDI